MVDAQAVASDGSPRRIAGGEAKLVGDVIPPGIAAAGHGNGHRRLDSNGPRRDRRDGGIAGQPFIAFMRQARRRFRSGKFFGVVRSLGPEFRIRGIFPLVSDVVPHLEVFHWAVRFAGGRVLMPAVAA